MDEPTIMEDNKKKKKAFGRASNGWRKRRVELVMGGAEGGANDRWERRTTVGLVVERILRKRETKRETGY